MRPLWFALVAGCYAPQVAPGGRCEATCPGTFECVHNQCVAPGTLRADATVLDATGVATPDVPSPADAPPIDPSLIAHWQLDDDPADGVLDSTGNGHTGTCVTSCPSLVTGVIGGGYRYDPGEGDAVRVADASAFRGVFTIAGWTRADSTTNGLSIMAKPFGSASLDSWQLDHRPATALIAFSGGSPHSLESPMSVPSNVWSHTAGTWDGTTKRLYINGVMVASSQATISYDNHVVYLGADENNGVLALPFDGVLDDLRIYSRVLSDQEIADLVQ